MLGVCSALDTLGVCSAVGTLGVCSGYARCVLRLGYARCVLCRGYTRCMLCREPHLQPSEMADLVSLQTQILLSGTVALTLAPCLNLNL